MIRVLSPRVGGTAVAVLVICALLVGIVRFDGHLRPPQRLRDTVPLRPNHTASPTPTVGRPAASATTVTPTDMASPAAAAATTAVTPSTLPGGPEPAATAPSPVPATPTPATPTPVTPETVLPTPTPRACAALEGVTYAFNRRPIVPGKADSMESMMLPPADYVFPSVESDAVVPSSSSSSVCAQAAGRFLLVSPNDDMGFHNLREAVINYVIITIELRAALVVLRLPQFDRNQPKNLPRPVRSAFVEPFMTQLDEFGAFFDEEWLRRRGVCVANSADMGSGLERLQTAHDFGVGLTLQTGLDELRRLVGNRTSFALYVGSPEAAYGTMAASYLLFTSRYVGLCARTPQCMYAALSVRVSPDIRVLADIAIKAARATCGGGEFVAMHLRARFCSVTTAILDAPLAAVRAAGIVESQTVLYLASELSAHAAVMARLQSTFKAVVSLATIMITAPDGQLVPLGAVLPLAALSAVNARVCSAADVFVGGDDGYSSFDAMVQFDRVARGARGTTYLGYYKKPSDC